MEKPVHIEIATRRPMDDVAGVVGRVLGTTMRRFSDGFVAEDAPASVALGPGDEGFTLDIDALWDDPASDVSGVAAKLRTDLANEEGITVH